MSNSLEETIQTVRKVAVSGAVAAAVLLVGAVILFAASLLFQVGQIAPFGIWGILGILAVAVLAAALVWWRSSRSGRGSASVIRAGVVLHAPPPAPVRTVRQAPPLGSVAGRLGAEAAVNALLAERRYDTALSRLAEMEASDPALTGYVRAKRRAIERRRARGR